MSKTILLIVRRHAGEVDWILPLLYKFYNNNNKVITIFSNKNAFRSLVNNKSLFLLWSKICKEYTIEKKTNSFFWKIIDVLLNKFIPKKYTVNILRSYVINKIFDVKKNIYDKFLINNIDLVFIEHNNPTYLLNILKEKDKKIKIIRFPESSMFFADKRENPSFISKKKIFNNIGDFFLFCSKANADHYFSGEKNHKIKSKIIYSNQLRYENWWRKKFSKKKNKSRFFYILIALRNYNQDYFHKKLYYKILKDIYFLTKDLKKIRLIFKIHPQDISEDQLRKDISFFDKKTYRITNDHMMSLSTHADLCISILTSASFDAVISNTPTIEYYDVKSEISLSPKAKEFLHLTYQKKNTKWLTVFSQKKILKNIDNYEKLLYEIKKIMLRDKKKLNDYKLHNKRLVRLSNQGKSSVSLYNLFKN